MTQVRKHLQGISASSGCASGRVKKVSFDNLHDILRDTENIDIVIVRSPFPSLVIALQYAKGLVTETGGITSHAAIVAREIGIPCIVGVPQATVYLDDGVEVYLDATRGELWYEAEVP